MLNINQQDRTQIYTVVHQSFTLLRLCVVYGLFLRSYGHLTFQLNQPNSPQSDRIYIQIFTRTHHSLCPLTNTTRTIKDPGIYYIEKLMQISALTNLKFINQTGCVWWVMYLYREGGIQNTIDILQKVDSFGLSSKKIHIKTQFFNCF